MTPKTRSIEQESYEHELALLTQGQANPINIHPHLGMHPEQTPSELIKPPGLANECVNR